MIHRTGRPARIDDFATSSGEVGRRAGRHLIRSAVGVPIVVHGRLPVTTELPETRFAPELEASACFVIAEALTNVVKHSQASVLSYVVAISSIRRMSGAPASRSAATCPSARGISPSRCA